MRNHLLILGLTLCFHALVMGQTTKPTDIFRKAFEGKGELVVSATQVDGSSVRKFLTPENADALTRVQRIDVLLQATGATPVTIASKLSCTTRYTDAGDEFCVLDAAIHDNVVVVAYSDGMGIYLWRISLYAVSDQQICVLSSEWLADPQGTSVNAKIAKVVLAFDSKEGWVAKISDRRADPSRPPSRYIRVKPQGHSFDGPRITPWQFDLVEDPEPPKP